MKNMSKEIKLNYQLNKAFKKFLKTKFNEIREKSIYEIYNEMEIPDNVSINREESESILQYLADLKNTDSSSLVFLLEED